MPKPSKSKTDVVADTTTSSAPVVVAPVSVAPVVASKPKKAKEPAVVPVSVAPVSVAPVSVAPISVAPVVTADAPETDVADLVAQSTEFLAKINQVASLLASLKTEYRSLEKKWSREIKTAQKSQAKRKRKTGNREPSGFVKPTKISDELALFLEKPVGTEMARTDVTREINKYIRSHDLQDKANGRKINPDTKLRSLLKLNTADELTYFNLQRYMSPHFAKKPSATTSA